jgi:serine/threonine protein kinase
MNSACPPDEQLLAFATDERAEPALREHVEHCTQCQMRVALLRGEIAELRSISAPQEGGPAETVLFGAATSLLPASALIGRYVVVAPLGSGGQADVYRVIDPSLGRDLVLKLSRRRSVGGDPRRDALLAEGRLLAQLDHPGLVRLFEIGIYEDRPFLVLDYVPGRNLEQIYADTRPAVAEAARLMADVARVVTHAHQRGAVHGDVTPRNVLIDGQGRARLIDFGMSKIEDAWHEDAGTPGGTPAFLPPERVSDGPQPGAVIPAGDVFGIGATLFWLLTGQAPFAAPTAAAALQRARDCEIDFDALERAHVPPAVQRICRRALSRDPKERPAADALTDELVRAATGRKFPRVAAAIIIAALALVGLIWTFSERPDRTEQMTSGIVHSAPWITVDGNLNLSNVLPLRTGDRILVQCNISQNQEAVVVWFNPAGELKLFEPARDIAGNVDRMVYPAPHEGRVLEGPEGTEMIFFCRGEPVSLDQLWACFPVGKPVPKLPSQNYLELLRDEVKTLGLRQRSAKSDEILPVETLMKEINRCLKRHFAGVTGIAFPHARAEETR